VESSIFEAAWPSLCIAAALEHKDTHNDCPRLSSPRSISLPILHFFCLHSFFLWFELGPQSLYLQVLDVIRVF